MKQNYRNVNQLFTHVWLVFQEELTEEKTPSKKKRFLATSPFMDTRLHMLRVLNHSLRISPPIPPFLPFLFCIIDTDPFAEAI